MERFSLLYFATMPPSIPIRGVHRCLNFSMFIELVKFESQCPAITGSVPFNQSIFGSS